MTGTALRRPIDFAPVTPRKITHTTFNHLTFVGNLGALKNNRYAELRETELRTVIYYGEHIVTLVSLKTFV